MRDSADSVGADTGGGAESTKPAQTRSTQTLTRNTPKTLADRARVASRLARIAASESSGFLVTLAYPLYSYAKVSASSMTLDQPARSLSCSIKL